MKIINTKNKSLEKLSILIQIWDQLTWKRRRQLFLLLIFIFFAGITEIFSLAAVIPFLTVITSPENLLDISFVQNVANLLNISESNELKILATGIFCGAAFLGSLVKLMNIWLGYKLSALIATDFSKKSYRNVLHQDYKYFLNNNSSELLSNITVNVSRTLTGIYGFIELFTSIIISTGITTALLIYNFKVGVSIGISLIILYFVTGFLSRKRLNKNSQIITQSQKRQVQSIQEGLGSIKDIIINQSQNKFIEEHTETEKRIRFRFAENNFLPLIPRYLIEGFALILFALISLRITLKYGLNSETILLLGTFALGAQRLLPSIQRIYSSWASISGNIFAIKAVLKMLKLKINSRIFNSYKGNLKFEKKINLRGIFYSYEGSDKFTLENINLSIKKGSRLAIIGPNGSGKSTLINIILGLLKPSKGDIFIDSYKLNYSSLDLLGWRSIIAHVPQSIYISDNTFAQNIAFGIPKHKINKDKVIKAAKKAQIHNFIKSRPLGYEENPGEGGVKLSGGQRQKLAIARAFYKNSKILIFDEATSAIDKKAEDYLLSSLQLLDRDITVIMITHNLNNLNEFDFIFKLEKGRIKLYDP